MSKCMYRSFEELPLILTSKDVQKVLGINNNGVYELFKRPGFPAIRVSERRIIVPRDKFLEWLDNSAEARLA